MCGGSRKRQGWDDCGTCEGSGRDPYHADDDDARSCNDCCKGKVPVEKKCYCGNGEMACGGCNGSGEVDD